MTWRKVLAVLVLVLAVVSPAAAQIASWQHNSRKFCYDNFQVDLDPWQGRAADAFDDPRQQRIALQACVGPGKTALEAMLGWKFLACHGERGDHPKGFALGVTWDNLKDNLWPEFAKWQSRSPFLCAAFTWTKERIFANDHPETWFLSARSWPKTASPEEQGKTLSGLHGKYVLVLCDESGTIPITVLRAADQALSVCIFGKVLQAGNPSSLDGMLYAAARQLRHLWTLIRITGDPDDPEAWVHSPRLAGLHKPDANGRCGCPKCWAAEQIRTYGRDNPWIMSAILGEFPPSSIQALLGVEDVEKAMRRRYVEDVYSWSQRRIGVDVARFGDDRTVMYPRQGVQSMNPIVMRHARDSAVSVNIANRLLAAKAKWGSELEIFDATGGWAAGAVDVLRAMGHTPLNVQFAAPAMDRRYANRRAELWFRMAEWVKADGALSDQFPEIVAELATPEYTFSKQGKFLLEDKEQVKKRIGRSPDLADALALTFGMVELPRADTTLADLRGRAARAATDWDPHAVPS